MAEWNPDNAEDAAARAKSWNKKVYIFVGGLLLTLVALLAIAFNWPINN